MPLSIVNEQSVLSVDEGGAIRVGGTRVTLDSLVADFNRGFTPEQIAQNFPSLSLADIYSAISYYLRHQPELDAHLAQEQKLADAFRAANPDLVPTGVRERLMARKQAARAR